MNQADSDLLATVMAMGNAVKNELDQDEPEDQTLPEIISELLGRLTAAQEHAKQVVVRKQKRRDAVIDDATKHLLTGIDQDFETEEEDVAALVADLTDEIKAATVQHGDTVKGDELQAVYSSGRVTWDNKGLIGYALADPRILRYKKVGQPYVSIKKC